jgi:hypothetical protein
MRDSIAMQRRLDESAAGGDRGGGGGGGGGEHFGVMLYNLGLQLERAGDVDAAVDEQLNALAVFRRVHGPGNDAEWVAKVMDKVGRLLRRQAADMRSRLGLERSP